MPTTIDPISPPVSEPAPSRTRVAVSVRHLSKRFRLRRPFIETLRHPFEQKYMQALNDVNVDIQEGDSSASSARTAPARRRCSRPWRRS